MLAVETELKIQELRRKLKRKHRLLQSALGSRQLAWEKVKRVSPTATLYAADLRDARAAAEQAGQIVQKLQKEIRQLEDEIDHLEHPGFWS